MANDAFGKHTPV